MILKISASSFRRLVLIGVLALGGSSETIAQGFRLQGSVFHVTPADSLPASSRFVFLHEFTELGGGAVDSTKTDYRGTYLFVVPSPEDGCTFYVSIEHDGIAYFSGARQPIDGGVDTVPPLVVFDTSYTQPDIELADRHIIVRSVRGGDRRQVIELVALRNAGRLTRIATDSTNPVWLGALPPDARQLEIGESDVGTGAVYRMGDSLAVAAPIPPGEKQILFTYMVPAVDALLSIPVDQPIGRMSVALEDTTAVLVGVLEPRGLETIGDAIYKRYESFGLPAGISIEAQFSVPLLSIQLLRNVVIVCATLALVGTLIWWNVRQRAEPAP